MAQIQSSQFSLWKRGIARGWITIWREREWHTALGALIGVFILLQLLFFAYFAAEGMQSLLRSRTDLRLEISENATVQNTQRFLSAVEQLPYVENSVYITKEQAYAQMKRKDPELISFIEEFNLDNPFPETVGITLQSLDKYADFKAFLEAEEWHDVVSANFLSEATQQEAQVYQLIGIANTGKTLITFFLGLTAFILIFITTELVRRRVLSRSEEILVEQLSGAHTFGILLPFATEAAVLLTMAVVGSVVFALLLLYGMPFLMPELSEESMGSVIEQMSPLLKTGLPVLILLQILLTPILGFFGAWLGIVPKMNTRSLAMLYR